MIRHLISLALITSSCSGANFGGSGSSPVPPQKGANATGSPTGGSTSGTTAGTTATTGGTTSGGTGGTGGGDSCVPGTTGSTPPVATTAGSSSPGCSTSGLGTDNGGSALQNIKIGAGMAFDGVTVITLDLQSGMVTYNNGATIASGRLPTLTLNLTDGLGNVTPVAIPLGGSGQIPNWRPAKSAQPTGYQNFVRNSSKSGEPPVVTTSMMGSVLKINIDDDKGNRPGSVSFPAFDFGLQF